MFREHSAEIEVVLSDVSMPRMNGWDLLAALRQMNPDLPMILASGFHESEVFADSHPEQPQVFLAKPYLMVDLKAAVAKAKRRE